MGKKRQTRAGPKCSKVVEPDDSEDLTEPAPKKNGKSKETSKESDERRSEDPLKNGSGSEQEDPLTVTSRVSSPTQEESEKDSADGEKRKDSDKSETEVEKVSNELNGKLDVPQGEVVSEGEKDQEETPTEKDKETSKESEKDPTPPEEEEEVEEEIDKQFEALKSEDKENAAEPSAKPGLRLVPLTQLLKPEVLVKPANDKTKYARKTTPRVTKSTSYIEISSDSEEVDQISLSSTDDEIVLKKSKSKRVSDAGSSKENKSTNNNLSNGGSKRFNFKEPMSPTKYMKKGQDLLVNVEKMPNNVNKLMKCYRVDEELSRIESWSETDDFENMISTSKIDRNAPEKSKQETKASEVSTSSKRSRKVRNDSDSDSKQETKRLEKTSSSRRTRKVRNGSDSDNEVELKTMEIKRLRSERKSAVKAKLRNKTVIEKDKYLSSSSSTDEDDVIPLRNTRDRKKSEPIASTSKSTKKTRKAVMTSENNSESESVKKRSHKDDHGQEKSKQKRRDKSSSSEDEVKPAPSTSKAKQTKESQQKSTRSKDSSKETGTRSSPRNGKGKKTKASNSSGNDDSGSSSDKEDNKSVKSSNSVKSYPTDDEQSMQPIKLGNSPVERGSTSESEIESLTSAGEDKKIKSSDLSGSETEAKEDEKEESTILEQKFRNRNKFEANSCFQKLKEKIEQRKTKQKPGDESSSSRESRRKLKNGAEIKKKSETNNNESGNETAASPAYEESDSSSIENPKTSTETRREKRLVTKRKRLLSSSDEEKENGSTKTPSKKKKMSSTEETDYEPQSGDEKTKDSDVDQSKNGSSSDDDDDDDEEPKKRKSKDSSDYDDGTDLEKSRPKNKRLKRIKKLASSDEDGENGDKSKSSGRKTIRKIIKADKLDISTKEAAKIERERKQRIEERQKMYNQFYDERPEEAKEITKLVLDFDEKSKKALLQVDKKLVRKLKPHQANGVKFMWDACFESLERCRNEAGSGCILAHCMGLGKTLQVITLVHTLLKNQDDTGVSRVLVVCPLSTVLNWVNEFNIWLKDIEGSEDIYVYEINKLKQNQDRSNKLKEWHKDGGILILSYDMFRNLTNDAGNKFRKKIKDELQSSLIDPGPDLVICDEGHLLKNEKTSISKAMMRLRTLRRIVLTGTPLQNNLKEYYCMVQFVKPNLLGKYQEYLNRFVNPITNGQYTDSTEYDIQIMRRRAHVLHKLLDGCVQRRDYSVLAPFLPPKHEYVMSIKLSPMQVKLYKYYMENKSRSNDENGGRKGSILFQDFQNLQRIWTAPLVLRYNSNRYELEMQRRKDMESEDESEGSLKDFIDDSESAASTSSSSSDAQSDDDATSIHSDDPKKGKKKKKQKNVPAQRRTRAKAADFPSDHEEEVATAAVKKENPTEWWMQICPEEELNNLEHSSKLMLLMSILEECEAIGDKLLVFSQSLYSLDVIEHFLNHIDEQTQLNPNKASFTGSWTLGQDYFRLDGSTPVEQRNANCKFFNNPLNTRARLFLISTRAGGLGINLVAANRVIIFDVSWNPSHDIQSIFRVYRFGQNKPCYIYRFLALGTMEEKIYERQVTKQAISKRVIDEQQIDRHYNQNDLQELYKYDLEPDDERILPILPKDRLFAEMLKKYENMIHTYHEHDTLLENKEEETLGEEERRQAWEEFEAEKNRPQFPTQYAPQQPRGIGPVTSNNIFGIRTDVLLKLLSMKARLDNRDMSEASVKQAIPLLMQELYRQMERGELTLYQQLLALSSSLEVPSNYGGQFHVNENMMFQTYNSMNAMPSTSSFQPGNQMLDRQQSVNNYNDIPQQLIRYARQQQQRQQMLTQQMKRKSPVVMGSVIEID